MISDVLSDAAAELEAYLVDPTFDGVYGAGMRQRIRELQAEMTSVAAALDRLPAENPPVE